MNKGEGGGGEGKLMDRVTKYENQTPFVVLACFSCSLRAHPMIPHPQNQIFVTGAKLGLYLYLSVSKNLINARGGEGGCKGKGERQRGRELHPVCHD